MYTLLCLVSPARKFACVLILRGFIVACRCTMQLRVLPQSPATLKCARSLSSVPLKRSTDVRSRRSVKTHAETKQLHCTPLT